MENEEKTTSKREDTGKGSFLKKLRNITCPYTGIRMIPSPTLNDVESKLAEMKDVREKLSFLSSFAPNMPPVEHLIFDHLIFYLNSNPDKGLKDYFKECFKEHLAKLQLEEFKVIDNVDAKSALLSVSTQLQLRKETINCRLQILNPDGNLFFKRKSFLEALAAIKAKRTCSFTLTYLFLPTKQFI